MVEMLVLAIVIRTAAIGWKFWPWAMGAALILLSYLEGRFRK